MCYSPVIITKVTLALRAAQKARQAGSVSNRLPNEHGEHGAECWLRLNISVFLIAAIVTMLLCNRFLFMYSYDVNVILL